MSESKYFELLRKLPRVSVFNIKANPGAYRKKANRRGQHGKHTKAKGTKHPLGKNLLNKFQNRIPKYGFNRDEDLKRQYLPVSLWSIQHLIDLGRIDPSQSIDLTTLMNCRAVKFRDDNYYGIFLVDQGSNIFQEKINIEVQIASELAIASVEKHGGVVTTSFYDRLSFSALCNPVKYFLKGNPIHKRQLPPTELVTYYTDPKVRGYLANPEEVVSERAKLASKYGYTLPDLNPEKLWPNHRKDPRQIFYGLSPGWIVNLADKTVLKPESDIHTKWSTL